MSRLGFERVSAAWTGSIWHQRPSRWFVPLAGLVLGLALFAFYQVQLAGRAERTARAVAASREELGRLVEDRGRLEERIAAVESAATALDLFYGDRLATESQRLTRMITEVKDLASRSGLVPQAISYPRETLEEFGLARRSFVFGVEGTYADLRKLVNFLELSGSFLTLEGVRLGSGGDRAGGRLAIDLALSTLFAVRPGESLELTPADAAPDAGPAPAPAEVAVETGE